MGTLRAVGTTGMAHVLLKTWPRCTPGTPWSGVLHAMPWPGLQYVVCPADVPVRNATVHSNGALHMCMAVWLLSQVNADALNHSIGQILVVHVEAWHALHMSDLVATFVPVQDHEAGRKHDSVKLYLLTEGICKIMCARSSFARV